MVLKVKKDGGEKASGSGVEVVNFYYGDVLKSLEEASAPVRARVLGRLGLDKTAGS